MEIGNRVKLKNNLTEKIFTIVQIYTEKNTSHDTKSLIGNIRIECIEGKNVITHTVDKSQVNLLD
jgi:hypothetical protein